MTVLELVTGARGVDGAGPFTVVAALVFVGFAWLAGSRRG